MCCEQAIEGEAHQAGGLCQLVGTAEAGAGWGGAEAAAGGDSPGPVGDVPHLRRQAPGAAPGQV